jgi:Type II secretion system (T2SS), protein E, N-terminal domain
MPVLRKLTVAQESYEAIAALPVPLADATVGSHASSAFFPVCANVRCSSSWIKLWRKRQVPVFEDKWACSAACMQEMVTSAVQREIAEMSDRVPLHQHRVPLGLLLLSQGVITQEQLKRALAAQKENGSGRLGEWLVAQGSVTEARVTQALGSQWNCPVLSGDHHDPSGMAAMLPRLLIDSFGALPLRMAGRGLLYLAFEDKIDRCMTLAVERMTGLKVEAGVLRGSEFRRLQQEALRASFPKTRLLEATNTRGLMLTLAGMVEECKPVQARLVRIHDYFWLRLWRTSPAEGGRKPVPAMSDVEDMVCALRN